MVAISTLNRLPESCINCPCSYNGQYEEGLYCGVSNEEIPREVMRDRRLNNCPLIEIKDMMNEIKHSEINGLWKPNYKEGFNDGIAKAVEVIKKYFPDV